MFTKLTLNISRPVIEKAKITARKRRTSISRLVEEFLKKISSEKNESIVDYMKKNAPLIKTPRDDEKKILKRKLTGKYGS